MMAHARESTMTHEDNISSLSRGYCVVMGDW